MLLILTSVTGLLAAAAMKHLHQKLALQRQDLCRQFVSRRLGYDVSCILQEGVLLL